MSSVKLDLQGLKRLEVGVAELQKNAEPFFKSSVKELAARLLSKVKKRTPVGVPPTDISDEVFKSYWAGYVGGTLRRGWTAKTEAEAMQGSGEGTDVITFLHGVAVLKDSRGYHITLINPVKYADYVEFGHRQEPGRFVPAIGKRLKKGFVPGQYMLTISEKEIAQQAPAILQRKLEKFLQEAFHD